MSKKNIPYWSWTSYWLLTDSISWHSSAIFRSGQQANCCVTSQQRWNLWELILKSLNSKLKSLALTPKKFSKMPSFLLEDSTIFWIAKKEEKYLEIAVCWTLTFFFVLFFWDHMISCGKCAVFWTLFFFVFEIPCNHAENLRFLKFVSLVFGLGLEHSCPWPREGLSSKVNPCLQIFLSPWP